MVILDSIFGDSKVKAAKEEWIKLQGQILAAETRLAEVEQFRESKRLRAKFRH